MLKQLLNEGREIDRIVDHWKEAGAELSVAKLRDAIGDDLEMLEYTPGQIETLVPQIMKRVRGN